MSRTTVAIHQPNYMPWQGYFAKMARCDVFVFLDDAQYTKNSYINRVQVLNSGRAHWLTVPVSVQLGQRIDEVRPARPDWVQSHTDALHGFYRKAPAFRDVWPVVAAAYEGCAGNLAHVNMHLVERIATLVGLAPNLMRSSAISVSVGRGDERLAALVQAIAPGGIYLSGGGGAKYQSEQTFTDAGLSLRYVDFTPAPYRQAGDAFVPGLSILDAAFHLGWDAVARLVRP